MVIISVVMSALQYVLKRALLEHRATFHYLYIRLYTKHGGGQKNCQRLLWR